MLKQEEAPAPRIQRMTNPSIAAPEKKEDQSLYSLAGNFLQMRSKWNSSESAEPQEP